MPSPHPDILTEEMEKLYLEEGWTLARIGAHFEISRQAVHVRLKKAGVPMRRTGSPSLEKDADLIRHMYVDQKLTTAEVGRATGLGHHLVWRVLRDAGIALRRRGPPQKYPQLLSLAIGESVVLPWSNERPNWHATFHVIAKREGIKLKGKRVDAGTVRLTRTG